MDIFYTRLTKRLEDDNFNSYLSQLPLSMQEKIIKFHRWEDSQLSLLGKILLLTAFTSLGISRDKINDVLYNEYNRPFFQDDLNFNISHSGQYVACVVHLGGEVGLDIEKIAEIDFEQFHDVFRPDELEQVRIDEDPIRKFYELWTKKEAIVKAIGEGLSWQLRSIDFKEKGIAEANGRTWYVKEVVLDKDYCCHVVSSSNVDPRKIFVQL